MYFLQDSHLYSRSAEPYAYANCNVYSYAYANGYRNIYSHAYTERDPASVAKSDSDGHGYSMWCAGDYQSAITAG